MFNMNNLSPMKKLFAGIIFLAALPSCSGHSVKEKLNSAGQKAGEAVGEVVHGVSSGVENAFRVSIQVSGSLKQKGIELGQVRLGDDKQGKDNLLSVYFIFHNDYTGNITCKAFDNAGLEMGRSTEKIEGKAGDARFYDFRFDPRTNIDRDSKITME